MDPGTLLTSAGRLIHLPARVKIGTNELVYLSFPNKTDAAATTSTVTTLDERQPTSRPRPVNPPQRVTINMPTEECASVVKRSTKPPQRVAINLTDRASMTGVVKPRNGENRLHRNLEDIKETPCTNFVKRNRTIRSISKTCHAKLLSSGTSSPIECPEVTELKKVLDYDEDEDNKNVTSSSSRPRTFSFVTLNNRDQSLKPSNEVGSAPKRGSTPLNNVFSDENSENGTAKYIKPKIVGNKNTEKKAAVPSKNHMPNLIKSVKKSNENNDIKKVINNNLSTKKSNKNEINYEKLKNLKPQNSHSAFSWAAKSQGNPIKSAGKFPLTNINTKTLLSAIDKYRKSNDDINDFIVILKKFEDQKVSQNENLVDLLADFLKFTSVITNIKSAFANVEHSFQSMLVSISGNIVANNDDSGDENNDGADDYIKKKTSTIKEITESINVLNIRSDSDKSDDGDNMNQVGDNGINIDKGSVVNSEVVNEKYKEIGADDVRNDDDDDKENIKLIIVNEKLNVVKKKDDDNDVIIIDDDNEITKSTTNTTVNSNNNAINSSLEIPPITTPQKQNDTQIPSESPLDLSVRKHLENILPLNLSGRDESDVIHRHGNNHDVATVRSKLLDRITDPVAKTFYDGDEKHFIPIETEDYE